MSADLASARSLWKRLKKDPQSDADAVSHAKKAYKKMKKMVAKKGSTNLEQQPSEGQAPTPHVVVGNKRSRAYIHENDNEAVDGPPTEESVMDTIKQAKAAWKALKASQADKAAIKMAKAKYKAAKASATNNAGSKSSKRLKVVTSDATSESANKSKSSKSTSSKTSFESFKDTPFDPALLSSLNAAGFVQPTPIQAQAWPIIVSGADLVAIAKTGSGKTLAFLLPAFHRLAKQKGTRSTNIPSPEILVIAPTRELCMQIADAAKQFSMAGMSTHAIYGGVPVHPMKVALQKERPRIVVATCGRLIDLLDRKCISLSNCNYVVLDEADRMLDMGFEPEMKKIFAAVPQSDSRQTLLFSATWPKSIRKLADKFLRPERQQLFIGNVSQDGELEANKAISQKFIQATDDEKEARLFDILNALEEKKAGNGGDKAVDYRAVVFANTKNRVDRLTRVFWDWEFGTCAVHGGKRQDERDKALAKFVSKECPVMFATDVAARGLDIKGVTHVINFDMARDVESYVHRIGRTGRAGELGESITFWNPDYDKQCSPALVKIARKAGQEVPMFLAKYEKVKANKQWSSAKAEKASEGVF